MMRSSCNRHPVTARNDWGDDADAPCLRAGAPPGGGRFLELAAAGRPFTAEDYAARTPDWAVFRHPSALPGDGGFDPAERRFRKHAPP